MLPTLLKIYGSVIAHNIQVNIIQHQNAYKCDKTYKYDKIKVS